MLDLLQDTRSKSRSSLNEVHTYQLSLVYPSRKLKLTKQNSIYSSKLYLGIHSFYVANQHQFTISSIVGGLEFRRNINLNLTSEYQ